MPKNSKDLVFLKLNALSDKIMSRESILILLKKIDSKNYGSLFESLRKTGKIKYIFLNHYYILSENERKFGTKYSSEEMVYAVLNKLKIKWHFSMQTALERKKLVWQASKTIIILNDYLSKRVVINRTSFLFIKTQSKYIKDISSSRTKNRIQMFIPSNEKLYLDYLHFKKRVPIEIKNKVNSKKIVLLSSSYSKPTQEKIKHEFKRT